MLEWMKQNQSWLFDGIGVVFVTSIGAFVWSIIRKRRNLPNSLATIPLDVLKAKTFVLFVDDDTRFKVVDILIKSGWTHTRRVSDVPSLDDEKVLTSQILFIDIQGVGRRLQFKDEGLGLAKAIKEKHPSKKVVIYSAEPQGERFHQALRKADDTLSKNADPYEFEQTVERLAREVWVS
jgi:DNA-binding NtrC family response regulator